MDLNINISQILRNNGYMAARCTNDVLLETLFERLKPLSTSRELTRIGGYGDGGYLVPDDLEGIEACFSPGVSSVASFEKDLARLGIRSHMADYSVDGTPETNPLFDFQKKFVGDSNSHTSMRLEDWVETKAGKQSKDLILQMDIEGSEFQVLLDTPRHTLQRFRIMVIEFHSLELLLSESVFNFYLQAFLKVLKDFCVVHIHPNNYTAPVTYKHFEIPQAVEITFYRKDRVILDNTPLTFPHLLDVKNVFDKPDIPLPECWRKNVNEIDDFLRTISGVIHVGANAGQERVLYDQFGLSVIWIEPIREIFEELEQNIQGFPNQTALNYLISDQDNKSHTLHISDNHGLSSSIFKPAGHCDLWPEVKFPDAVTMEGSTLATVFARHSIALEDYQALVLDTQGAELLTLSGLGDLVRQFRYIKTEAADFEAYEGCCQLHEITAHLAHHGFEQKIKTPMTNRADGGNYFEVLYVRP